MDLHRKTERKDLLTEHLYTIIRENELRKAKKLEELMTKLNVSTEDADFVQQTGCLEIGSDKSLTKQNNADISVSLAEEMASSQNQELNLESKNSQVDTNYSQVDNVADTTASKEAKADSIVESLVTESFPENEVAATS